MNNNVPLEQILFANYIKYDKLSKMVESTFQGSNATSVNIFIDIYSMLRNIHSNENFITENQLIITSSLLNLCAHMRKFFRQRYRVETKIFLVHSNNTPTYNKQLWLGYNNLHEQVLYKQGAVNTNILIQRNMKVLDMFAPYLPNIYFLETEFEAGVLIYDIICHNESIGNTNPNIILSTDFYLFQLVNMSENTYIFRPKKYKSEDLSYVVSRDNLLECLFKSRNVKIPEYINKLHPGLYTLLLTLSRCPERSIKSFFNLPTASQIIYSGICRHRILNGYNSNTENIWYSLYDKSFDKYSLDLFDRRFKVIDLFSQYLVYLNNKHTHIKLLDLIDPDNVKEINNTYFKKYPIDLNNL